MMRNWKFHNDSVPRDITAGGTLKFGSESTLEASAVWENTEINMSPCFVFIGCVKGVLDLHNNIILCYIDININKINNNNNNIFIVITSFLFINVCAAATDGHSVSAGHRTSQVEMSPQLQTSLSFITIVTIITRIIIICITVSQTPKIDSVK